MADQDFAILFNLCGLVNSLHHDVVLLGRIKFIIPVIGYFLKHETISRSKCDIDAVLSKGIVHKVFAVKTSMEHLDNRANHLSNLVV